ncbi:MAG: glycosyltransferase family 4 protein, partial [Solirubrobacterales bacterium]|nr:glycosyltransferase family 4 protein [Solirubrobacterales bacterium]
MSPLGRRRPAGPLRVRTPPALLDVLRDGPAPLAPGANPDAADLDIAIVIPQFRRGSGGHHTIADLVRGLEARGHRLSLWVEDEEGRHEGEDVDKLFPQFFGPVAARTRVGSPPPSDVVVATGWQTVPAALRATAKARAYLVQDHEPEFYGTSAERLWAAWTYGQGLHCICASPWLADLVRDQYGASASPFDLGVAHEHYRPLPTHRRDDLVLVYGRAVTPRRAVPLALLAMTELHRRRPDVEIALFGEAREVATPFPHRHLGVLEPPQLAHAYASAAVGLVLSLTNPSLVPTEMLACGLPVVDVASPSMVATFGAGGPVELAEPDPLALCAAVERLLDDLVLR